MAHRLRQGAAKVDFYDTPRTVSAEWVVDSQGVPSKINVPVGTGVMHSDEFRIVHLRNERAGWSRTYTPEVIVTIDHAEPHYELEFYNPNQPSFMPSVAISSYISFRADNGQEGYTFSNRAMFETLCAFMSSPVYNPFETPVPLIDRADACPKEDAYCEIVSFRFQNDRPLPVWDRHDKEDVLLVPGVYDGRIPSWNRETGDPETLYVRGDNTNGGWIAEGHIKWPVFANEIRLGYLRWEDFAKRVPFDPSQYRPRAYDGPVVERRTFQATADMRPTGTFSTLDTYLGILRRIGKAKGE